MIRKKYSNNLFKLMSIDRFSDVTLGVLRKGVLPGGVFVGRKDNHWNVAEGRIGFEFGENRSSVFAGKNEIQKDKLRSETLRIFALTPQETESLHTVLD